MMSCVGKAFESYMSLSRASGSTELDIDGAPATPIEPQDVARLQELFELNPETFDAVFKDACEGISEILNEMEASADRLKEIQHGLIYFDAVRAFGL